MLSAEVSDASWELGGSIPVPGWLRPIPTRSDRSGILVDAFVDFIDHGGCRRFAEKTADLVTSEVLPGFPCMIAVDHSLTGGVYQALADHYGKENLSLVILDSHTDALPMSTLAGAIMYDIDTNPSTHYDRTDPFLYNRPDSYNASSFIHHMIAEGIIDPRNLYIIGVSDYPRKRTLRIKDRRIVDYVTAFTGLKKKGATVITKNDCMLKTSKVKKLLKKIRTPYVYLSVDMDIGARNAVEGVRFRNWQGLQEKQIYRVVDSIAEAGHKRWELVGMDVTEFNPRIAGRMFGTVKDRTYEVAANLVKKMVFNMNNNLY
jgi:arginase family enzyme